MERTLRALLTLRAEVERDALANACGVWGGEISPSAMLRRLDGVLDALMEESDSEGMPLKSSANAIRSELLGQNGAVPRFGGKDAS